jgi:urea transport system substrate-binding protein
MEIVGKSVLQLILLFSLLWLICCAWPTESIGAAGGEPIKIGAVLPFSGGVEVYGRQAKIGLDLATKEINAGSGILGRPLQVIYEDDQTDPTVAAKATRKLIEHDSVLAVVGPITSRNFDAMKSAVEGAKTPLLYATNYEGGACNRYIFAFGSVPNQELAQLLPYMNQNFGDTYYLLGADHAWPQKMFNVAQPSLHNSAARFLVRSSPLARKRTSLPRSDESPRLTRKSYCSRLKAMA